MAKRRSKGQGTILVRADKRVVARLNIGPNDEGKPIRIEKYFTGKQAKQDAQAWLNEQIVLHGKGVNLNPIKVTFGELAQEFLVIKKALRSATTYDKYKALHRSHLADWDNLKPNEALAKAQGLILRLTTDHSSATVREVWQIARQIFEMALEKDLIRRIPKMQLPEIRNRVPRLYTDEQLRELIAVAQKSRYAPALWLELGSGLRRGEVLALKWDDILEDRVVINKGLIRDGGKVVVKDEPKTKAGDRLVFVPKFIMDKIHALPHHKSGIVFPSEVGSYVAPWNFTRQFRNWREAVDKKMEEKVKKDPDFSYVPLADARFHDLRHLFVSWMHRLGVTMTVSQAQAGHADIKTHVARYSHASESELIDAANRVGKELERIFSPQGVNKVSNGAKKAPEPIRPEALN